MRDFKRTFLAVSILCLGVLCACENITSEDLSRPEKIHFAVTPWPGSAALYIARKKGYFEEQGIDADFHSYISGHLGLDALFSGTVDCAVAGDTPIARAIIGQKPVAVIATICEIDRAILIVARKDRGILSPADLKGKKVGVVKGTTADFFLDILLVTSYIRPSEVHIVDLTAQNMVHALVSGTVDAVSTWSPHTLEAGDQLGDNAVMIHDPSLYKMTWNLVVSRGWIRKSPESIQKVLLAIIKANEFIRENPQEARSITSENMGTKSPFVKKEWEDYTFTVELGQSLVLNLEDQARWLRRRTDMEMRSPLNFVEFIFSKALKAVQPAALTIPGL